MVEAYIEKGSNDIRGMDMDEARHVVQYAALADQLHTLEEQGMPREEAEETMINSLKEKGINLEIVSVEDSTAFVASDPKTNEIVVAFYNNVPGFINFLPAEHPLGGDVYGSVRNTFTAENENGLFADQLKEAIENSAKDMDGPSDLKMTGFSKAGAMAVAGTGWLMAEGFFRENPDIHLESVMTFGSFPCGDSEFNQNFMQEINKMDVDVFRITGGENDPVPTLFTEEAPLYGRAPFADYEHVGTQIELQGVSNHDSGAYVNALHTPQGLDAAVVGGGVVMNAPEDVPPAPPPLGM